MHPTYPYKLFTTSDIAYRLINLYPGFDTGSFHIPFIFDLKIRSYPYKLDQHPVLQIQDNRNADWALYSTKLSNRLSNAQTPNVLTGLPRTPFL